MGAILSISNANNFNSDRWWSQGYDDAATIGGIYRGMQVKILEQQPNGPYAHCGSHNL